MSPQRHDSMASVLKRPDVRSLPQPTRADSDDERELADAAWLYAWSYEALRPVTERRSAAR